MNKEELDEAQLAIILKAIDVIEDEELATQNKMIKKYMADYVEKESREDFVKGFDKLIHKYSGTTVSEKTTKEIIEEIVKNKTLKLTENVLEKLSEFFMPLLPLNPEMNSIGVRSTGDEIFTSEEAKTASELSPWLLVRIDDPIVSTLGSQIKFQKVKHGEVDDPSVIVMVDGRKQSIQTERTLDEDVYIVHLEKTIGLPVDEQIEDDGTWPPNNPNWFR